MFFKKTLVLVFLTIGFTMLGQQEPEFSTAGFYKLEGTGRNTFSMNPAWRFHKGNLPVVEKKNFNDKNWAVVSLPNGIEYLQEASGGILVAYL